MVQVTRSVERVRSPVARDPLALVFIQLKLRDDYLSMGVFPHDQRSAICRKSGIMKRIIVTGGGSGIGAAIAQRARDDGFAVTTIDLKGGDLTADLSDEEQTVDAFSKAVSLGPVYGLVNNVGSIQVASVQDLTVEKLDWSMRINLQSTVLSTQAVIPSMKDQGVGRIVNISSRAVLGKVGRSAYAAAKAAVLGMSRTWALELGEYGITVNSVCPGPIRTPLFERANPADSPATQQIIDSVPVRRLGEPADVAHSVAHFLDERGGFVTGQTTYVCGGITLGLASLM